MNLINQRIKLFEYSDFDLIKAEKEVNQWILIQRDIEIMGLSIGIATKTGGEMKTIISIVYKVQ